jgi:thiol-disulfide isomerase/thioredoxin
MELAKNMKHKSRALAAFALIFTLALGLGFSVSARQDKEMMMKDAKPVVAIVKADWCGYCRKLDPTMKELMSEYGDRLTFVVLDVTDEASAAKAMEMAKKHGLESFLAAHKDKTGTVAVFDAKHKEVFKARANYDREAYVKAFDKALGKSMKS